MRYYQKAGQNDRQAFREAPYLYFTASPKNLGQKRNDSESEDDWTPFAICRLCGGARRWNHSWNQSTVLGDWNGPSRILSGTGRTSCSLLSHRFGHGFLQHVRGLCAANLSSSVASSTRSKCMCGAASAHRVSVSYTYFLIIWTLQGCFKFTRKHCWGLPRSDLEKKMTTGYFRRTTTRSHLCSQWKEKNRITVLQWPSQSPHANPIENVWSAMKHKLREKRAFTIQRLTLREIWKSFPCPLGENLKVCPDAAKL